MRAAGRLVLGRVDWRPACWLGAMPRRCAAGIGPGFHRGPDGVTARSSRLADRTVSSLTSASRGCSPDAIRRLPDRAARRAPRRQSPYRPLVRRAPGPQYRGATWTIEAGDTYFSPAWATIRFANLFAPAVTFNGASVDRREPPQTIVVLAGRTTAWRSIFGNDPQALGQTLAVARVTHTPTSRLELNAPRLARPHLVAQGIQLHD